MKAKRKSQKSNDIWSFDETALPDILLTPAELLFRKMRCFLSFELGFIVVTIATSTGTFAKACSLTGPFFYSADQSTIITFGPVESDGVTYIGSCTGISCGWKAVTTVVDSVKPSWGRLQLTFDNGLISAGWLLGANCSENVIYFGGTAQYSSPWCRSGNTNCTAPFDAAWTAGTVHILEVS